MVKKTTGRKQEGPVWIWYPGDFEIYHGMLQNFQREERGYGWPAYWKMDDWRKNICFYRSYLLDESTKFRVTGYGEGYVAVNGKKYPLGQWISCSSGKQKIEIFIGNMTGLPCVYVEGDVIYSGNDWMADDFVKRGMVGTSPLYIEKEKNPNVVYYEEEVCTPYAVTETKGGVLFDFKRMINGRLILHLKDSEAVVTVCYGESELEACSTDWCYYKQELVKADTILRRRAFRFIFIPDCRQDEVECTGIHQYLPIEVKASFSCEDEELNAIWQVAKETYCLCSGLFFLDGIKRDRWIWSGDAYQSFLVNPYLFFDEEINKRTMLALRGNDEMVQHINTIVDYSLLWLISMEQEYQMTGDKGFAELVFPKMEGLMELCRSQLDDHGFIYGRERDWIFIDWSDMDKEGTVCAEQILLLKCYETMLYLGRILGKDMAEYEHARCCLKKNILEFFWNEEKGAFIDSYESGRQHVTRHANIFAILFDVADQEKTSRIINNVLLNPDITQITTPYFKFFELDVWGKTGHLDKVFRTMKEYWGGMLDKGAVTFWEEYIPEQDEPEQYGMYGDPFGKSLCHAWGASPIYLLGRYFLGVRPLTPGYETFLVEPRTEFFRELDCVVPVKGGSIRITWRDGKLEVRADREGGLLRVNGEEWVIECCC